MKRETDKEPVRSKKTPLFKVRQNYRVGSAALQADQAIKHISVSLPSQKNISTVKEGRGVGVERGSDKKKGVRKGRETDRKTGRKERRSYSSSPFSYSLVLF